MSGRRRETEQAAHRRTTTAPQHWWAATARPRRRGDVRESELDHEVVLFDPRSGDTLHFNETAFLVWSQCDGTTTIERIGQDLSERYDIEYDTAVDHVDQLVAVFSESGLLELDGVE